MLENSGLQKSMELAEVEYHDIQTIDNFDFNLGAR